MRISVVIPVFEDREQLQRCLPSVEFADEAIVVDSSREDPVQAGDLPEGARLLRSGVALRSHQMNLGAAQAQGEIVLFLHADTRLPAGARELLCDAMGESEVVGGGFEREFESSSRFLEWTCRMAAWRSRWFGWFLGDQALFVRRAVFEDAGGFSSLLVFEDYDLCRRLKKAGRLRCLRPPVLSSARRFAGGAVSRTLKDLVLTFAYFASGGRLFRAKQIDEIKVGRDSRTT